MVGYSNATYLLTTGARYPADARVLSGIFAELVDAPQDMFPRAVALAEGIVTNVSPMAAYLNRQLIWRNAGSAEGAHLVDSPLLYDMFAGRYVQHRAAHNDLCWTVPPPAAIFIDANCGSEIIWHSSLLSLTSENQSSMQSSQRMRLGHIPDGGNCLFGSKIKPR